MKESEYITDIKVEFGKKSRSVLGDDVKFPNGVTVYVDDNVVTTEKEK